MKSKSCIAVAAIGLSLSLIDSGAIAVKSSKYAYQKMADTSSSFSSFGLPVINNAGTVAFSANTDGALGAYTSTGKTITTIAENVGLYESIGSPIAINDTGTVAFVATPARGTTTTEYPTETIFTSTNGKVTQVPAYKPSPESGYPAYDRIVSLALNNRGTIAYVAQNMRGIGVLSSDGRLIAEASDARLSTVDSANINDRGTIVYRSQSGRAFEIFANKGTKTTTLSSTTYPLYVMAPKNGAFSPSLNNRGTVAYVALEIKPTSEYTAEFNPAKAAILKSNGTKITTVADTNGAYSSFSSGNNYNSAAVPPTINDRGTVAFFAQLDTGGEGIFIGSDPVKHKVIATGDSLFGYMVQSVALSTDGINDFGQVTFIARLANGTEVIVRADPLGTGCNCFVK
ncbi:MAG: hypothetical protein CLLPBCKN_005899 [Chroococcidiopsis cubana SAG 39.79]|uniref:Uncharacterized protein n=1 Tax=Chroococcidiopsis cubana SAG 39.79 TaxID=388085 RepID=A0AB37UC16_9CYAN|nr:choice-of-anchor tandem repeat NxxGxxAF-containing protein [Chroococcidiopsis cubana]MDZ4876479.1 hypothetical protein [Chroococcidiopsis cubana SAG 39.79]PSB62106.1 hypothetical protein C7B79_19410 [Chroococcidiopsis cubana CCALA 043]RUT05353.1 hypothetical protein DSM107010_55690 [Chroococcidiopsis cubana SAG 39.79]